jgi:hypothetical protein
MIPASQHWLDSLSPSRKYTLSAPEHCAFGTPEFEALSLVTAELTFGTNNVVVLSTCHLRSIQLDRIAGGYRYKSHWRTSQRGPIDIADPSPEGIKGLGQGDRIARKSRLSFLLSYQVSAQCQEP